MPGQFRITALSPSDDRQAFCCGAQPLDLYFRSQVTQDIKRRITACFTAIADDGSVAGYYTLASASISLSDLLPTITRKLPRYPSVPAVRMGRLAVDQKFKGHGLGAALLSDALSRALAADIAAFALLVDAKNTTAAAFYQHHGFIALLDQSLTLFLPLASVKGINATPAPQ